jgi:hypothetical protein
MTAPAAPARHTKPAPADLRKFEVAGPGVVTTIGVTAPSSQVGAWRS